MIDAKHIVSLLDEVVELPQQNDVREDDVEKLAEEFISNVGVFTSKTSGLQTYLKEDFKEGLIRFHKQMEFKAKENTYTEEQIIDLINKTTDFEIQIIAQQEAIFAPSFVRGVEWFKEKIIQSLKQPK